MFYSLSRTGLSEIKGQKSANDLSGSNVYNYQNGLLSRKTKKNTARIKSFMQPAKKVKKLNEEIINADCVKLTNIADNITQSTATPLQREYRLPKSKIRNKILAFFNLEQSKKFGAFYSISFPINTTDDVCYQLFNTLLTRCRKLQGLTTYIWVAERQKNGTLHFHVITNNRMNIEEVNGYMRSSLATAIKKGLLPTYYTNSEGYNGVDVDNMYFSKRSKNRNKRLSFAESHKKITQYITKYVTKNNTVFSRLVWHCSRNISALFTKQLYTDIIETDLPEVLIGEARNIKMILGEFITHYAFFFNISNHYFTLMDRINQLIYDTISVAISSRKNKETPAISCLG